MVTEPDVLFPNTIELPVAEDATKLPPPPAISQSTFIDVLTLYFRPPPPPKLPSPFGGYPEPPPTAVEEIAAPD